MRGQKGHSVATVGHLMVGQLLVGQVGGAVGRSGSV